MKIGRAYGFFECNASKKRIETELPTIRTLAQIPSGLELSLVEGVDKLGVRDDSKINRIIKKAKEKGIRFGVDAPYLDATNKKAANEVAALFNQTYQSNLYKPKEPFKGEIVYEKDGEYVFRE